ncbi:MAG: MopE-related protein [Sandaracinaceae bacterium]|nr:MopE-related protein [Sandaracinaceae bacterium]
MGPAAETCNGVDDDCDGATDELFDPARAAPTSASAAWGPRPARRARGARARAARGRSPKSATAPETTTATGRWTTAARAWTEARGAAAPTSAPARPGPRPASAGGWAACTGAVGPSAETCNGVDDDCDGSTDESLTRSCGTDVGACVAGTETCSAGSWGAAWARWGPIAERCDGVLDDDCDGLRDEGCDCVTGTTRSCGTDTGACVAGTETCDSAGRWGACTGAVGPTTEVCDDVDNDCDGTRDEGLARSCGTDTGACTLGTETCSSGTWGTCTGGIGPSTELCDGSVDQDCDGLVDEGCACINGQTRSCGSSVGRCDPGTETCNLMGVWGSCTGAVGPVAETCNGIDDDCDGSVDEGACSLPVAMCPAGMTAEVLSTVTLSASGSDPDGGTVTYRWTVIGRPAGSSSTPSSPNSATSNFFLDAAGTYTLQFCVTDDEGNTSCCTTEVVSTPPGVLHVELQWDQGWGDVDLHLLNVTRTPPDGWFTTDDCYFANAAPDWGPGGAAANPTLDRDDRDGYGPENVTIDVSPQSGTYNIGAHLYCSSSAGGSGPVTATVRVYCMGALVGTYTGVRFDETDDWVTVANVEWPSCRTRSVNARTNGTSILPPSFTVPRHCEIRCTTNADCPTGERCALVGGGGPPRYACVI